MSQTYPLSIIDLHILIDKTTTLHQLWPSVPYFYNIIKLQCNYVLTIELERNVINGTLKIHRENAIMREC